MKREVTRRREERSFLLLLSAGNRGRASRGIWVIFCREDCFDDVIYESFCNCCGTFVERMLV